MARVIATGTNTEVISGCVSDQISVACAPTPIAPTVWAIVFRVRIAASGRSTFSRKRCRRLPVGLPRCICTCA